ncbi:MAG TPA: glutamate-5-semialdehyde dehydrogenase [Chroococcales cyanobacterium]
MTESVREVVQRAKDASYRLGALPTECKDRALRAIADRLESRKDFILAANREDLIFAEKLVEAGKMSRALFDRLKIDEKKIFSMAAGVRDVAKLEDPVGKIGWEMELDQGLRLERISVPLGVLAVIFEARPDVVLQVAALALKSSNAVILKGGSEAARSNVALLTLVKEAVAEIESEFLSEAFQLIESREEVKILLGLEDLIDLVIPRGSSQLVKYIQENTRIPVLGHTEGICHVFIDESADLDKAGKITVDSKTQYPAACNSVETLLVHRAISKKALPLLAEALEAAGVKLSGDAETRLIFPMEEATEADWRTEYSDKILSVRIVADLGEAIAHINRYGSGHTDSIVTENKESARIFMEQVDSAGVFHNASTRFADGFRYGLGAEIGISTNKTHARGPVGLEGLVIYKYRLFGEGQVVADYANGKAFTHRRSR